MSDRSMAIKHAKAKKEAIKEMTNGANDLAQTSCGTTAKQKANFARSAYSFPDIKRFL